ncbi:IS256 family transposase ISCth4 [Terrisporobacter vanillatitrophus]
MLQAEMNNHLGYEPYERDESYNSRNRNKSKKVRSTYGEFQIDVPQDRNSPFEPKIVKKRQKDISSIETKIISMYAKDLSTRQILDKIDEIYGFEVSESIVSDITDRLLTEIEDWQHRPLSQVYPIIYIDAVHFSVRDNHTIKKLAAYFILGINEDGKKDVLTIQVGQN